MTPTLKSLLWSAVATLLCATPGFAENIRISWNANPEPNIGGYRLSYGTAPGTYPTTVDVGNQTTALVPGLTPGQRYYFVVRAYDTAGLVSPPSAEVTGVALGVVALTSNALSYPIATGAPVTWTALASSPAQTLEYQFARLNQATGVWTIVQPYGSQNTFTWTPAVGEEGAYVMRVWVRVSGSTDQFDARRETAPFTVVNDGLVIGTLETDTAFPAATGAPITFKAKATGGPGPLQYRFYRFNRQTNVWTMERDYSTAESFTWTPTAADVGNHSLQVWVRRDGSTATYDAYRTGDLFSIANMAPGVAVVRSTTSFPVGTGTPITWKATAGGGPGPLQYKFYRLARATNTWTMVQDYGPSSTYTWTPTAGEAGTYALQVWVRRAGSTADFEAWNSTPDFTITDAVPVIRGVTSDGGGPIGAGAPVTFTVDATGGPGPLQYGFSLYSVAKDAWSAVQGFSSNNTFTWLPGPWDAGSYVLQVSVSRPGAQGAEAVRTTSFDVAATTLPVILTFARAPGSVTGAGRPIVFTATAAGGGSPLEYLFARYNYATGQWTTVQTYGWDNTYGWVPTVADKGSFLMAVFVRRTGYPQAYEQVAYSGTIVIP
jgi:hypothetical protein